MSIFSLHVGHKTTGLRDYGTWACLEVPKSRVPKSKDNVVYF